MATAMFCTCTPRWRCLWWPAKSRQKSGCGSLPSLGDVIVSSSTSINNALFDDHSTIVIYHHDHHYKNVHLTHVISSEMIGPNVQRMEWRRLMTLTHTHTHTHTRARLYDDANKAKCSLAHGVHLWTATNEHGEPTRDEWQLWTKRMSNRPHAPLYGLNGQQLIYAEQSQRRKDDGEIAVVTSGNKYRAKSHHSSPAIQSHFTSLRRMFFLHRLYIWSCTFLTEACQCRNHTITIKTSIIILTM